MNFRKNIERINKNSQISIFIIIGFVLIFLIIILMFFIEKESDVSDLQVQYRDIAQIDDPVEKFVTECLKIVSKRAIKQMGEHGGYVSLSDNGFNINTNRPTESDAVVFPIAGSLRPGEEPYAIPYYYHMTSRDGCLRDCQFEFQIPYLYRTEGPVSVESEMDKFIINNIKECFNDFESFKAQGYEFKLEDDIEIVSEINLEDISFTLRYPVEFVKGDVKHTLRDFYYKHNIEFFPTYELAVVLTALQYQYRFLEQHALNLIGAFSGVEKEMPPFSDSTFEFGSPGRFWSKTRIANYFQNLLLKYVQAIRVIGTDNYVERGDDIRLNRVLDTQMQITLPVAYAREVYFSYLPFWPIYFDLDCEGEICKPDSFSFSMLALMIGNQRYRFHYSASYPVLVKIYDPYAFDGEGFTYYFALQSNFRYNRAIREGQISGLDLNFFEETFLCKENQRNSGVYNFSFRNALTDELVPDVAVYFSCAGVSCTLEKSEDGFFSQKLPICTQGVLTFEKQGFMSKSILVQSYLDEGEDFGEIYLNPLRRKNITINKLKFVKGTDGVGAWVERGTSLLEQNQEAMIFLTKKDVALGGQEFMQVISLTGENHTEEIDIVPGLYDVQVTLLDRNNIVIPEDRRRTGGILSQSYTIPEFRFNESSPWLLGGIETELHISHIMDNHDTLVLNVVSFELKDIPQENRKIEDLEILGMTSYYTNKYRERLGFTYE